MSIGHFPLDETETPLDKSNMRGLGDIIRDRLKELDRGPVEAAQIASPPLKKGYIADILRKNPRSVNSEFIPQLAQALDWSVEQLNHQLRLAEADRRPTQKAIAEPSAPPLIKMGGVEKPLARTANDNSEIIIYGGAAAAGKDFSYALERVAERIPRPNGVMGRPGIYGLRITDASMSPAFSITDLVFVDAQTEVHPGDDVVVEEHLDADEIGARRYFRRLKRIEGRRYICRRLNPPGDQTFEADDIRLIHRIIPVREVFDD